MAVSDDGRIPLSISQQNIYHGVLQDPDPALYRIGKSYRFRPLAPAAFLSALEAMVLDNPVQLCVLEPSTTGDGHPELVARLRFEDIVCVRPGSTQTLPELWADGILGTPLVRYVVHTDADGRVVGMDAQSHHILLDGAATAIIEADLARHLGDPEQKPGVAAGLALVAAAHRSEHVKVAESTERHVAAVRRELTDEALCGSSMPGAAAAALGTAGRGVLRESCRVADRAYDEIIELAETRQAPLNILVAAAATAVHASLSQNTEALLVHPVDNRFGAPELNVATCLVNSVAHPVRFAPFAAVRDVVMVIDRGYVKALRRRWFREERYRRMHLAITRGVPVEALTVNYLRGRSAAELSPYLSEPPVVTDIGPVEGMTVACVHDEARRTIDVAVWTRHDQPEGTGQTGVADRIVAALRAMDAHWELPIALTVGEWSGLAADGRLEAGTGIPVQPPAGAGAWFLDVDLGQCRGPGVDQWIAEIIRRGVDPGDVLVFVDDDSQRAVELLIACHLAGCGYSVCAAPGDVAARVVAIAEQCATGAHAVELSGPRGELDGATRQLVEERIGQVGRDHRLGARLAYVMPTSGSTGSPKLVPVTHGSLAIFCAAARESYGWEPADTVLQCAPLTSDISVEEIFGALSGGARVVRSAAMRAGDVPALTRDVAARIATVLDLPTAVWHLLCEDDEALAALGGSALRQVIIGGEAVRPSAVDKWLYSAAGQAISLVSTYGPTESTVVVTHLPIGADEPAPTRARLGHPLVPGSVFVAFGEIVVVGELVSAGYLGLDSASFGTVQAPDGSRQRVFATGDRVATDDAGHPVLAGRRDAVVKIAGKRFDTAALLRRLAAVPEISDVAVEPAGNGLGIWFQSALTRSGDDDPAARARVRSLARAQGAPAFSVIGVPGIPRQPNGKVDRAKLAADIEPPCHDADQDPRAAALAELWSRLLERPIGPSASLLDEGIGSLDLIRILPETRRFLDWQLSILDLIGADSAVDIVDRRPDVDSWMDEETAAQIADDLAAAGQPAARAVRERSRGDRAQTVVILGASGILGTGFAQAILDRAHAGLDCPGVVFAARSPLPEHDPWSGLHSVDGVDIVRIPADPTATELAALLDGVGAVVNCIGNTNVLVPYRRLRAANVSAVASIAQACARRGAGLVQLSTFVVNADVTAPRVTDPRHAPYPYAASKSLAEIVVSRATGGLDFSVVRLPRVLGDAHQRARSSDILVAMVDACTALGVCPVVPVTEEVTTGVAAAHRILGLLPQLSPAVELGRGMTVLRGEKVSYTAFLNSLGFEDIALAEWKDRLDRSVWAARNPQRWAVLDAWLGLGARLQGRTYADYLAEYPTIEVDFAAVAECTSAPEPLRGVFGADQIVRK